MTKYVLNSGGMRDKPDLSKQFFTEVVKGLGNMPRILLCFFAEKREEWEAKYTEDIETLPRLMPHSVKPIFELALPDTFEKQLEASDVLYMHGGDDHLVQYWLRQFKIPRIFEGKVIATNSASSHALVASFWTCDWRKCMDGLGVLPIKFLAHYKSSFGNDDPRGPIDWDRAYKDLSVYGDTSLPIHALEEGHYIIIER